MKKIAAYIVQYLYTTEKRILVLSTLFIAIAIFINYYHGLNKRINTFDEERQFVSWYFVFLTAFSFAYILQAAFKRSGIFNNWRFTVLLLLAPALFAWKMAYNMHFNFSANEVVNAYWNAVAYWPFRLLVMTFLLFITWRIFDRDQPFYGLTTKNFHAKPYWIMLLLMVPLVAAASTQPDFLAVYPKLKNIIYLRSDENSRLYTVLYELAYGSDFFSIELFFRGFLVLAFARWVGKDAILPMALFYCTIHFGKPLGECISSYFGGMILGVVTFHDTGRRYFPYPHHLGWIDCTPGHCVADGVRWLFGK
jgi:hypothetical protein